MHVKCSSPLLPGPSPCRPSIGVPQESMLEQIIAVQAANGVGQLKPLPMQNKLAPCCRPGSQTEIIKHR